MHALRLRGTLDFLARLHGVPTLGDYKTGRAIYAEAYRQNVAYRHAAGQQGLAAAQGVIVRLPKRLDDPGFEVGWVPDTVTLDEFRAALSLWRWARRMAGLPTGDAPREDAVHADAKESEA